MQCTKRKGNARPQATHRGKVSVLLLLLLRVCVRVRVSRLQHGTHTHTQRETHERLVFRERKADEAERFSNDDTQRDSPSSPTHASSSSAEETAGLLAVISSVSSPFIFASRGISRVSLPRSHHH